MAVQQPVTASTPSAAEQVAWEAERRPRLAIATVLAGLLTLGGGIWSQLAVYSKYPSVGLVQALDPALHGRPDEAVNPRSTGIAFLADHATSLFGATVVVGAGTVVMGAVLVFIFRATKARRPELPNLAYYAALAGALAVSILGIVRQVVMSVNAQSFVDGTDRSRAAVEAVNGGGALTAVALIAVLGQLALGLAFVLVALNAMRSGLLTRFMGVLGIIVGVLFVIPIGSPLPIVQAFWLVALSALFLGRWPSGMPPAWQSGEAVPWPSQQEMREARMRQRGMTPPKREKVPAGVGAGGDDHDDEAEPPRAPHPSSTKKRRKRR
jgi:hypothetical protein